MGRRYLIIKTSALGDVVQTLPTVGFLKEREPDCKIDWIVEKGAADLLRACPLLDRVIEVDTKKWRKKCYAPSSWKAFSEACRQLREHSYDAVFDLQGNVKSALWTFLCHSPVKVGLAKENIPEWPNLLTTNTKIALPEHLNIREDYLWILSQYFHVPLPLIPPAIPFVIDATDALEVDTLLQRATQPILLAPGSAWENKRLSKEQLEALVRTISQESTLFLAWGTSEEKALCESLMNGHPRAVVLPKLSLPALHLLMTKMTLVVSVDSLSLHLAAIAGVPTRSYFGPSLGEKYAPKGILHMHIQGECPYGKVFTKRCPILRTCETGACIKNITIT